MHKDKLNELLDLLKDTAWQITPTTHSTQPDRTAEFPILECELLREIGALLQKIFTQSDDNETRPQLEALINNYPHNIVKVREILTEIKNALFEEAVESLNEMNGQAKISQLFKKSSISAIRHLIENPKTKNIIIERLNSFNRITDILVSLRIDELRALAGNQSLEKLLSDRLRQLKNKKYAKARKGTFEREFINSCQDINDEAALRHYMLGFIASLDAKNEVIVITELLDSKGEEMPLLLAQALNARRDSLIAKKITPDEELKFDNFINTILNAATPERTSGEKNIESTISLPRHLNEIITGYYEHDDANPSPRNFAQLINSLQERTRHLLTEQSHIPTLWAEFGLAYKALYLTHKTGQKNGSPSIDGEIKEINRVLLIAVLRLVIEKPAFHFGKTGNIIDSSYALLVHVASKEQLHHFFTANNNQQLKALISNMSHLDIFNQIQFMSLLCSRVDFDIYKSRLIIKTLVPIVNKMAAKEGQELLVDILLSDDIHMPIGFKTFALDCISMQNAISSAAGTMRLATSAYQAASSSSSSSTHSRKRGADDDKPDEGAPATKHHKK